MDQNIRSQIDWNNLAERLTGALHLAANPIGITFSVNKPDDIQPFNRPTSTRTPDGRQGKVPAGCVFWMHADKLTFTTEKKDHGNCTVGSFTHGLSDLTPETKYEDIKTLLETGWVGEADVAMLPHVSGSPEYVTYGPLNDTPPTLDLDVVLMRINGRQLMILSDALADLKIVGKPQCHIIAIAKEQGFPAASVGCALSRVRTGMKPEEMTCALPADKLADIVVQIENAVSIVNRVAKYAAHDAKRFA